MAIYGVPNTTLNPVRRNSKGARLHLLPKTFRARGKEGQRQAKRGRETRTSTVRSHRYRETKCTAGQSTFQGCLNTLQGSRRTTARGKVTEQKWKLELVAEYDQL